MSYPQQPPPNGAYPPGGARAYPNSPGYPPAQPGYGQPTYGYPPPAVPVPAAPQGYGQPAPGYAPANYGQQSAPGGYAPPAGYTVPSTMANPGCRFCGSVPVANVTFRGHQGMIVLMRFLHMKGPFCRDCGLATFRQMTSRTLVQGWYGYASFIITPITILINLVRRGKVASLPAPQRQMGVRASLQAPMDPGPPLMARPMTWLGLIIPIGLLILFVAVLVVANSG
jgi:hypothetical protein